MKKLAPAMPLFSFPFRVFFLLVGLYGTVMIAAWLGVLLGGIALPVGWSSLHWHSHEMLFGLVSAAIAGFLLTAMCNWTGAAPLRNKGLLALALLWLAGRLVMWTASWWPAEVVAFIDWLFLPIMAVYVLRVLLAHGNKRNLPLAAILLVLSCANLMMHIGFITEHTVWLTFGQLLAFNLITLMMVVIGGRIIPMFTANWLRQHKPTAARVTSSAHLERAVLLSTALVIPVDFIWQLPWLVGVVAFIAGLLNLVRLIGWAGLRTGDEPLLWILHLGYAWLVLALLGKSAAAFGWLMPSVWQHALGVGAMATLILGIMTRVALGHTGRPLKLPQFAVFIYLAITLAAVARIAVALSWLNYSVGLLLAGCAWTLAFGLFVGIYWPILSCPRVDAR